MNSSSAQTATYLPGLVKSTIDKLSGIFRRQTPAQIYMELSEKRERREEARSKSLNQQHPSKKNEERSPEGMAMALKSKMYSFGAFDENEFNEDNRFPRNLDQTESILNITETRGNRVKELRKKILREQFKRKRTTALQKEQEKVDYSIEMGYQREIDDIMCSGKDSRSDFEFGKPKKLKRVLKIDKQLSKRRIKPGKTYDLTKANTSVRVKLGKLEDGEFEKFQEKLFQNVFKKNPWKQIPFQKPTLGQVIDKMDASLRRSQTDKRPTWREEQSIFQGYRPETAPKMMEDPRLMEMEMGIANTKSSQIFRPANLMQLLDEREYESSLRK